MSVNDWWRCVVRQRQHTLRFGLIWISIKSRSGFGWVAILFGPIARDRDNLGLQPVKGKILTAAEPNSTPIANPTEPQGRDLAIARFRLGYLKLTDADLQQFNPVSLAFLGDAVYELVMRQRLLFPPKRVQDYHQQVVAEVRAEQQSYYLKQLEPHLTEAEKDIVRRGRNAAPKSRRVDPGIYQRATGLETLVGYLYLTDVPRLEDLLDRIVAPTLPGIAPPFG
jgi:ribonuclease III family protein